MTNSFLFCRPRRPLRLVSIPDLCPEPPTGYDTLFVYFTEEATSGIIKIGCSWNPRKRKIQLARKFPGEMLALRVLTWVYGGYELEHKLHERFSHIRHWSEWFHPGPDLVELIGAISIGHFIGSVGLIG